MCVFALKLLAIDLFILERGRIFTCFALLCVCVYDKRVCAVSCVCVCAFLVRRYVERDFISVRTLYVWAHIFWHRVYNIVCMCVVYFSFSVCYCQRVDGLENL